MEWGDGDEFGCNIRKDGDEIRGVDRAACVRASAFGRMDVVIIASLAGTEGGRCWTHGRWIILVLEHRS
jgi:hypothetical protein